MEGSGEAGEASWVQLGYGAFKLRHVMAGKVGCVIVRWGSVGHGQARQASLGEFRWVAFWLGRLGTFSLGKLR
jgi:hypothetical protein